MLAAQYAIALPTDFDMTVIRRRVADRGPLLDRYPGLGLKAYLIEDATRGGARNQYAPMYLWNDTAATAAFLWGGGGFAGIVRDFGRPSVATWLGAAFLRGPSLDRVPTTAVLTRWPLIAAGDPVDDVARLLGAAQELVADADLHSVAVLIDPTRWEGALFAMWRGGPARPPRNGTVFEVLHLSAPAIDGLDGGS